MVYKSQNKKLYGGRRKRRLPAARLHQTAAGTTPYAAQATRVSDTIQANISSISLFLSKYLSGKGNIVIAPVQGGRGYSVAKVTLPGGQIAFQIRVPHWGTYKLPLDDKSKYRIYRNGIWHEGMHVRFTPEQVYQFGTKTTPGAGTYSGPTVTVDKPLVHDVINILEDRRIEDKGTELWTGYQAERLFSNAYAWSRRMDVGGFWNIYLKSHYDDVKDKFETDQYGKVPDHILERLGNMRHEAFLQRLLVMKIKGSDQLPKAERDRIEKEAKLVERQLAQLNKLDPDKDAVKIFSQLASLTYRVIQDLDLRRYVPPITEVGESSWDQSFTPHDPKPGEEAQTRAGIDDYFDELMSIEVVCAQCGKHYIKKYGTRED